MSEWKAKRFWADAQIAPAGQGYGIKLDGRDLRTPFKNVLVVPTEALAAEVAAEWRAQGDIVDPETMPVTRLANSAQEKVAANPVVVADYLAEYGGSDMLCYRAAEPDALVARQAAAWDPLLDWADRALGVRLIRQTGVMPILQPQASLDRIAALTHALDPFVLTGFHELVTLSGSWVIGYAALYGEADPDTLWSAAVLDETWQAEVWGEDEEASALRAAKKAAFETGLRFARLGSAD